MSYLLYKTPRNDRLFVRVLIPEGFKHLNHRTIESLSKRVYEIANRTGSARFADFPIDDNGFIAMEIAQRCCEDEEEYNRVMDVIRAFVYLYSIRTNIKISLNLSQASNDFITEKHSASSYSYS